MRLNENFVCASVIIFFLFFLICWPILSAYQEARVYKKVTGKDVSTWDALWVELRIEASPDK